MNKYILAIAIAISISFIYMLYFLELLGRLAIETPVESIYIGITALFFIISIPLSFISAIINELMSLILCNLPMLKDYLCLPESYAFHNIGIIFSIIAVFAIAYIIDKLLNRVSNKK